MVTMVVVRLANKLGIVDDPKEHIHPKVVHTEPVPRGGGIPIIVSLVVGIGLWLFGDIQMVGVVSGALILAIWGFVDDRHGERIPPVVRLIFANIAAAVCVVGVGIFVPYVTNPFGGVIRLDQWLIMGLPWVSMIVSVVWLVAMQNIVGWSSGVDGQLPGFVVVAAITMAILTNRLGGAGITSVMILAAITAGAYAGFLPWNWWPQKIMTGYGGKSLAGFLLGVLAILSFGKVGTMMMVLGVPIVDALVVILKRIRERRSIFMGGREHMHHYLLDMGWSKRAIASFYTGIAMVFAVLALALKGEAKLFTMAAVLLVLGGSLLWLQNWSTYSKQPDPDSG
jgi:UDP-GlcNAc:undecaprenyl-phosphate GlcNAc-1-phosphate transferase